MDASVADTVSADDCDVDLMMSDVPIDNPDVGASLPNAEEVRTTSSSRQLSSSNPSSAKRRKYLCVAGGGLVLLAIVLGLALGLTGSSSSKEPAARKAQFDDVLSYLAQANISTTKDMRQSNSPQNKAVTWLAEIDNRNLAIPTNGVSSAPGYYFVTRYVLAVLYYSTAGEGWNQQLDWLSGKDLCNWNGLKLIPSDSGTIPVYTGAFCDLDQRVIRSLRLGE